MNMLPRERRFWFTLAIVVAVIVIYWETIDE
jgi:hypothetical protein